MKQNYRIIVSLNDQANLKDLVENLASCRTDMGYCQVPLPQQWKALEISSTQAFIMGSFNVETKAENFVNHAEKFLLQG